MLLYTNKSKLPNSKMLKARLQFQKVDKYRNNVFICRDPSSETYKQLTEMNEKIMGKYENATSSIYINDELEYITLRTIKNPKYAFKEKNIYDISVQFKYKKNEDEREYINTVLVLSKCVEKYIEHNGDDISF